MLWNQRKPMSRRHERPEQFGARCAVTVHRREKLASSRICPLGGHFAGQIDPISCSSEEVAQNFPRVGTDHGGSLFLQFTAREKFPSDRQSAGEHLLEASKLSGIYHSVRAQYF